MKLTIISIFFFGTSLILCAQIPTTHLQSWYRSDSVVQASNKISLVYDLSGNGRDLAQPIEAKKPLLEADVINGYPAIKFDGIDDFLLKNFGQSFSQPNTVFVLWRPLVAKQQSVFDGINATERILFWYQLSETKLKVTAGTSLAFNKPNLFGFTIHCTSINGASTVVFENGSQVVAGNAGNMAISGFTVGCSYNSSNFLNGQVLEIIYYDTVLNSTDRISVENYLMDKYSPDLNLGTDISIENSLCDTLLTIDSSFTNVLWSTGETNDTIYVSESGTYFVQAKDIFGRVKYDTISVSFPSPEISNSELCLGDSILYNPQLIGSFTYLWSDLSTSASRYYKDEGNYWSRIEDSFGCFDTVFFSIDVDSFPNYISLGNDTSLCSGNYISLIEGEGLCTDFLWTPSGSTLSQEIIMSSGWQKIEVHNTNGCYAADSIYVTVTGVSPIPDFDIENLCEGDFTSFTDLSTPSADINLWRWIFNNNDTIFQQNPLWQFGSDGEQDVNLYLETTVGCSKDTSFVIVINEKPDVSFNFSQICSGIEAEFIPQIVVPSSTNISYLEWNVNDISVSNNDTLYYVFPFEDVYEVRLTVQLDNGCYAEYVRNVDVYSSFPELTEFTCVYPNQESSMCTNVVDFMWNNESLAIYYRLVIYDNPELDNIIFESPILTESSINVVLPQAFDTLYWKVIAFDPCLNPTESEIRSFIINNPITYLNNIEFWYAADSVKNNGSAVEEIYDISSSNRDLVQAISTNQPNLANDILASQIIKFDGINDFLSVDFVDTLYQPSTIFVLWKPQVGKNQNVFDGINATSRMTLYYTYSSRELRFFAGTNIPIEKDSVFDFKIHTISVNGESTIISENGALLEDGNSGNQFLTGFKLGCHYGNIQYLDGYIAEIIYSSHLLDSITSSFVESYLYNKYSPPVNLSYDIRVPYGFCDTAITTAYKPWFTDYLWSTGETDSIIHVNRPGVYSVTVTDIFGFESSDDIRVFYPEVNDFADTVVCFGNSVVWDAELVGDYSFAWYGSSETYRAITIDAEGDYAVIVNDTLGCQYLSDTISFSLDNYEFTASVGPADTSLCAGNRLMLVTNSPETISYLWSTGSTSPEIVLASSGTYSVTTTNWRGCEANDAIDVTITGTVPVPLFSSEGHCAQNPVYFTDLSTSSDGTINSWTWSINGEIFSTEQNPILTPGDIPNATARGSLSGVEGYRVVPTTKSNETNATARFHRVVPPETSGAEGHRVVPTETHRETQSSNISRASNYQVQLTISTDANCSDFITQDLTIYPLPTVSFTPQLVCQNTAVEFTSTSTVSGGTIINDTWEFLPQSKVTERSRSHRLPVNRSTDQPINRSTDKPINWSTDQPINRSTDQPTNRSTDQPINWSTDQPINRSTDQPINWSTDKPINWSTDQPVNRSTDKPINWSTDQPINRSTDQPTNWSTDQPTNRSTDQPTNRSTGQPINRSTDQPINRSTDQPINRSTDQQINRSTDKPINRSTDSKLPRDSIAWSHQKPRYSSKSLITHTFVNPGYHTVQLISTTDAGCVDSAEFEVYVKPAELPQFSAENTCLGEPVYFINQTPYNPVSLISEINWNFGDGESSSITSPQHIFGDAGLHNIDLTINYSNGCILGTTQEIEVYHKPVVEIVSLSACEGSAFGLVPQASVESGNIATYNWQLGDPVFFESDQDSPDLGIADAGNYPISLEVSSDLGCSTLVSDTLRVHEAPESDFTASRTWGAVPLWVDFTNTSLGAEAYTWSVNNEQFSSDENPYFVFQDSGLFVVELTSYNEFGCHDISTLTIKSVIPVMDIILYSLRTVVEGDYLKTSVYIINNGTLPVEQLNLDLNLGSGKIYRETIENVEPSQVMDYTFTFKPYLASGELPELVCVEAVDPTYGIYTDINYENNTVCNTNVQNLLVFRPYPNPASNQIICEFITAKTENITITLINGIGKVVYQNAYPNHTGYQKTLIDVSTFSQGVYYLQVLTGEEKQSFKIEINR